MSHLSRKLTIFAVVILITALVPIVGCPPRDTGPVAGETRTFDGMEFQWCPSGTFVMGSPASEVGRDSDETQHQVTISEGFWLGKYEVAQAQWIAVMGNNPSFFPGSTEPVENISWHDAQIFIAALNANKAVLAGPYRLPTESEWEYACRAGTTTRFYWGEDSAETAIDDYAWYEGNSAASTHPAGEKMPNAWGLYDMSGNVKEWCQDWHGDYPAGSVTDPQGPASGTIRIYRGGSWAGDPGPRACRSANRAGRPQDYRANSLGFRLLRTPD